MKNRHEAASFDPSQWVCVSVQSPLGAVTLARRMPLITRRSAAIKRELLDGVTRRFDLSTQPDPAARRARSRRQP